MPKPEGISFVHITAKEAFPLGDQMDNWIDYVSTDIMHICVLYYQPIPDEMDIFYGDANAFHVRA